MSTDDPAAVQLALPLEPGPPADTPPPCPCCRGRRSLLAGWGGWLRCTWCEGSGADPEAITPALPHTRARNSRSDPPAAVAAPERLAS